ncbi:hypothetical protein EC973_000799 [Apophysomyces ossiformis]|uniref:OTU domain-containing protein n=1 Tax=Apophysomyces ossiformis TaxID=679940 RepID=A0A8H7BQW0_9FUNG|nr:hypothetical protein EC973_000799 [Apophysomyces ossiformis]
MTKDKGRKSKRHTAKTKKQRKERRARKGTFTMDGGEDLDSQLRSLNLCTKDMAGDGNCLFRALSDQFHGSDSRHKMIRQEICTYLRANEETYKYFVEDDQSFDYHVDCMENDGTFGGNMELAAFARLKGVDIKVYQPGMIYIITGTEEEESEQDSEDKQVLHIAYHSWEHYSSVRNLDGPFTGPPEVHSMELNDESESDDGIEDSEFSSREKVVREACPDVEPRKIRRLLRKHKGNTDKVIDVLYSVIETEENPEKPVIDDARHAEDNDSKEDKNENSHLEPSTQEATKDEPASAQAAEAIESLIQPAVEQPDKQELIPKPKKIPARERKRQAKLRQKENQRAKKQQQPKEAENDEGKAMTQAMKQLYI